MGAGFAYWAVVFGVFITALYSFRMFFLVFHGKERMDEHTREHLHETPAVVTLPLVLLAIPSLLIGLFTIEPLLFGKFFEKAIYVTHEHNPFHSEHFHGVIGFMLHGMTQLPFFLAMAGLGTAYYLYQVNPELPEKVKQRFTFVYNILLEKYGFDRFNDWFFAGGARGIGTRLWNTGDVLLIDGIMVNGSAKTVGLLSNTVRHLQTGLLYHYAFAMILGLALLLGVFVLL
jgi:NADH-quinone oxidoreductase subunit L